MGFNLKMFFEELEELVSHSISHIELLEFIEENREYAQVCGMLR